MEDPEETRRAKLEALRASRPQLGWIEEDGDLAAMEQRCGVGEGEGEGDTEPDAAPTSTEELIAAVESFGDKEQREQHERQAQADKGAPRFKTEKLFWNSRPEAERLGFVANSKPFVRKIPATWEEHLRMSLGDYTVLLIDRLSAFGYLPVQTSVEYSHNGMVADRQIVYRPMRAGVLPIEENPDAEIIREYANLHLCLGDIYEAFEFDPDKYRIAAMAFPFMAELARIEWEQYGDWVESEAKNALHQAEELRRRGKDQETMRAEGEEYCKCWEDAKSKGEKWESFIDDLATKKGLKASRIKARITYYRNSLKK